MLMRIRHRAQTMEATSFSPSIRPVDVIIEIWSISMRSVRGIPTLNSVAFNLLTLA